MKNRENASFNILLSERKNCKVKEKKASSRSSKCVHKGTKIVPPPKRRTDCLKYICWIIVPMIVLVFVLLDAFAIYRLNKERLIVLGNGLLIILLPFINEIKLKDVSFKRKDKDDKSS